MSDSQLQKNLQSDIETLKHIRLDILPAKQYYKDIFKGWGFVYLCLISALFLGCLFAYSINAWPYTPGYESKMYKLKKYGLTRPTPGTIADAVWQRDKERLFDEKVNQIKEVERPYHEVIVKKMILGVLGISLFLMLFIASYIKMYVIFKNQISSHLKTGGYLQRKIWQAYAFFIGCFLVFSVIAVSLFEQDLVFFAGIPAFIFTAIASSFLIDMEFTRIGISPLTNAIANYFGRDKTELANN